MRRLHGCPRSERHSDNESDGNHEREPSQPCRERPAPQYEHRSSGEEDGVNSAEGEVGVPLHRVHASYHGGIEAVSARRERGPHHRRVTHEQHGQSGKGRTEGGGGDPAPGTLRLAKERPETADEDNE